MGRVVIILFMLLMMGSGLGVEAAEKEVGLRMIIVRSLKEAKAIQKQLRQGASFSALAREKSIGPQRRQWGFSGVVRLDEVQDDLRPVLKRLKMGQVSEVVELGKNFALIRVIPAQITTLFASAKQDLQADKLESSIKALHKVLKLEPDNVPAHMMLGVVYGKAKKPSKAIPFLKKAQAYASREAQIPMLLGVMYAEVATTSKPQANAKQAIKSYQQALKLNKRMEPAVEFGIGKVYALVLKQPDKAIGHLEKAVAGQPNIPEVHEMLIQAYYDTKRYKKALQKLRAAQNQGFKFPELLTALNKVSK